MAWQSRKYKQVDQGHCNGLLDITDILYDLHILNSYTTRGRKYDVSDIVNSVLGALVGVTGTKVVLDIYIYLNLQYVQ